MAQPLCQVYGGGAQDHRGGASPSPPQVRPPPSPHCPFPAQNLLSGPPAGKGVVLRAAGTLAPEEPGLGAGGGMGAETPPQGGRDPGPAPSPGLWLFSSVTALSLLTTCGHRAGLQHDTRILWTGTRRFRGVDSLAQTLSQYQNPQGHCLLGPHKVPHLWGGAFPPYNCHLDNIRLPLPGCWPLSQKWGRQAGLFSPLEPQPGVALPRRSLARPVLGCTRHAHPPLAAHVLTGDPE